MFLLLYPKLLFAQIDNAQKIKIEFLIDLKYNLLFQKKYSIEINQQLKEALRNTLKGNFLKENLIEIKNEDFHFDKFLKNDQVIKKCVDGVKSYSYDTNIYQFSKQKYPFDKKILQQLRSYSFADSTMDVDDYYFVLAFEIHQLLEILNGTCCTKTLKSQQACVVDTLSVSSFVDLSKFDFHRLTSIILNEFEDAHLSLYSTFTYSFYKPTYTSVAKAIKPLGDTAFLMVKIDSPIVSNLNSVDTISFSIATQAKLDTLQKISQRKNGINYLKSKFIDESYNIENKRKSDLFLIQDSIIFIDIQRIKNQSKKSLSHYEKRHDIKLIVFDLRGYTGLAESAYKVITKAIKVKSKIAVLVDKNTYSLSEILARKLSYFDNTTVIGECTAGAMGETNIVKLNRSFSLQYTANWYEADALNNYSLRKVCPDKNYKFELPAGFLFGREFNKIVELTN